jgi:hypothetical protein
MKSVVAVSRACARLLLALVLASPFATLSARPLAAAELPVGATLSIIAVPVEVASNGSDLFADATQGQLVLPGDVVRTGSGGLAVLTFFDGSESQLASDSQIQVQRADYAPAPNIVLLQNAGVSVNRVIPLPPGGNFETDTPTAVGLVRGTSYVVSVDPASPDADAALVSSMVLLTDRDGHVGHVQVASSGSPDVVDLIQAGDVGATDGKSAAAAHLPAPALADMEDAARDLHDGQSAQVSARRAHGFVDLVAPLLRVTAPNPRSGDIDWDDVKVHTAGDPADARPRADGDPQAGTRSQADGKPQADTNSQSDTKPQTDPKPQSDPKPQADSRPQADTRPQSDPKPQPATSQPSMPKPQPATSQASMPKPQPTTSQQRPAKP